MTTLCLSLSFVVTRCHLLSLLSFIVTRCISRLSFYKQSRLLVYFVNEKTNGNCNNWKIYKINELINVIKFIKRQTSGTSSENEWQRMKKSGTTSEYEWQQVTMRDNEWYNEWQRVTMSSTTSDNEWYNEWKRVKTSDKEWQRVTMNDEWQRMTMSGTTNGCVSSNTNAFLLILQNF